MSINIDRLKLLRKMTKLDQESTAKKLGVPVGTYRNWEQGIREPNTKILILLADYFGTTADYLLGMPDAEQLDQKALLELLKNSSTQMLAKISGELTEEGKKDLLKYAELLRNQKNSEWID